MRVADLIKDLNIISINGNVDREVTEVVRDSRGITENCLFICIKGANFDGHTAAEDAFDINAAAVVISDDIDVPVDTETAVIKVSDTREAMALISAAYFGYPTKKLKVIGITGTKGKTTTTYLIKSILENAGIKTGLIGTIETIIGDVHIPSVNTTPESYVLQETFAKMVSEGIEVCVMEASSQGFLMKRTLGIDFEIGIFTNIEPDHIGPNEHKDFDDYLACKRQLFKQCRYGIFNADSEHVNEMLEGHTCIVKTYGVENKADYMASDIEFYTEKGVLCTKYKVSGDVNMDVVINMPGMFSVYNALTAVAVCSLLNVGEENIKKALRNSAVKGRIEMVKVSDDYTLLIDYAHNAMALESLLTTLKAYEAGRIVTLFGCGGNRAKSRRYEMGEVSGKLSDLTIITSDNPRYENPKDIINDIISGISKTKGEYVSITDRKEAIKYAISNAKPDDIIILAGKGHEDYQEIEGKKYPMDERVLIAEVMEELGMK